MTTAVFLSVRNKATRLPGKVLLDLGGRSVTARLIERLQRVRECSRVVVTTSTHTDDAVLAEIAREAGADVFRGSEDDKLDRYLQAARRFGVEVAAVVDGDDPFCDPGYIDRLFRAVRADGADYGSVAGLPLGITANVVRVAALERVCAIKTQHDTEVWGGYFTETGLFKTCILEADVEDRDADLRLTLDYQEDYDVIQTVFDALHADNHAFSITDIVAFVRRHPDLKRRNAEAGRRYEENLKRHAKVGVRMGSA